MNKFYTFQPVLVRNSSKDEWCPDFFDKEIISNFGQGEVVYWTVGQNCFNYCIPYEGNEKYIHTTDTPNPNSTEWKPTPGELVAVRDYDADSWNIRWFEEIYTDGTYKCLRWDDPDDTITWNQCISIDALKKLEHPHKKCQQ